MGCPRMGMGYESEYHRGHEALHQCNWAWAPTRPKTVTKSNPKHHHHQSLGLGSNLSPSPLPYMGKPKAAISSWASPSDEVSTISDIDERERVVALRRRSCCQWDLAYGTGLQSPPKALGRQQKSSYSRHSPSKKKN